ncbi:MAG: IclR family transcriptional regulator [Alcaligenaceae bacterium]|nr:MAG: IclR family transcriptional regulator [Alcaligenaceae bacterium]
MQILKLLGAHQSTGLSALEIVSATGEERSAVQRSLSGLMQEGLAERGPSLHRWRLGVEAMHLGRATLFESPLTAKYRFALQALARKTGDTVYLGVRLGDFVLCLHREEGSSAVRSARTRIGDLVPLGITAGGVAILGNMKDDDIAVLYHRHALGFEAARLNLAGLHRRIAVARRNGYAVITDGVSEGASGIGIGLGDGEPFATVSIGTATARLGSGRAQELHALLRKLAESSG